MGDFATLGRAKVAQRARSGRRGGRGTSLTGALGDFAAPGRAEVAHRLRWGGGQGAYGAGLVSDFVPLYQPPDSPAVSGSLWFHVRGSEVHVAESPLADIAGQQFLGMLGTVACWAADMPADGAEPEPDGYQDLRRLWGHVPELQWTIAGRAVQLVEFARTHRFCGRCGTATEQAPSERALRCPDCGLLSFPRLAPAVIVLVTRGEEALLARGRNFPLPMYSCLAGFVEPGETLEEAVHREVREEVGVALADVRYVASQPWPFPHSLDARLHRDVGRWRHRDRPDRDHGRPVVRSRRGADDPAGDVDRAPAHRRLARSAIVKRSPEALTGSAHRKRSPEALT